MPTSTMREESEYRLPENTPFPAQLKSVDTRTIKYQRDGKDKQFDKWEWVFEITEGEYAGMEAYGETEDRLTNHPDNKVRQWAETLRGSEFEMGEGLDTDDIIGLPCIITVANLKEEKKGSPGEFYYKTPVKDVFPADAVDHEPPF